jgi:tetratricopeptide (TPR) repeat protein
MATKEVMVSAPLIVFLYDRTFVSGGFREAWNRHRWFLLSLAATWLPLALLMLRTGNRGGSAGAGIGIAWWSYALTQFPAILRYLQLVVWPHPLVFDYGTQWVKNPWTVLPSAALVIALVGATVYALWRRPALGFLGVFFFAILAPTSLVPGNRQTMAEHRMYLALAPVIVAAVWGIHAWLGRRSKVPLAVLSVVLGLAASRRNEVYQSNLGLWTDSVLKCPDNTFARDNLGALLAQAGNRPAAAEQFEAAIKLKPDDFNAHNNWGTLLAQTGRPTEAIEQFKQALRIDSSFAVTHYNLGVSLSQTGQTAAALEQFAEALRINPNYIGARYNLAYLLAQSGRLPEAIAQYNQVLRLNPDLREAHYALGLALRAAGRIEEAEAQFKLARPPKAAP